MATAPRRIGQGRFNYATAASAATLNLSAIEEQRIKVSGAATITSFGVATGNLVKYIESTGNWIIQNGPNILCPGYRDLRAFIGDVFRVSCDGTDWKVEISARGSGAPVLGLRGYIDGLMLKNNVTTPNTKIDIQPGQATDADTGLLMWCLDTALTVDLTTTGAAGLDTGSLANNTWYHVFLIGKANGEVSAVVSASFGSPTMPSGYSYKRRIGSIKTNGSAQVIPFLQVGDEFWWQTSVSDASALATGTTAALLALTVPPDVKVKPIIKYNASAGTQPLLSDPDLLDLAPGVMTGAVGFDVNNVTMTYAGVVWTDTSRQVRHRSIAAGTLNLITRGWIDPRGRNL